MFDVKSLSLSTLHRISSNIYNNSMVLNSEKIILKVLNYDLFIRDKLIIDRLGLYLESIRFLLPVKDFTKFHELANKITDLIYEDFSFVKEVDLNLLCSGIIQAALIFATKRDGNCR